MSGDLVPQVDVGNLTLRGLSAFTPLLAALTADNVTPMSMIQLESLGALYHINGPYAAKVPDLLRRCSSVKLDRMAVSIGWRKGDTASIMAESSAGQAIALMCLCLKNLCVQHSVGEVLYDLSESVLARSISVHCSVSQLEEAAHLLSAKLEVIGFGNILAEQTVKIHDAYAQLGIPLPREFFDFLTRESMVLLFESLSKVFKDEDTILRIAGVHTMGHIVTLMSVMFPENVMLTIEGFIFREGPRPSIVLEINSSQGQNVPTIIQIEKKFGDPSGNAMPFEFVPAENFLMPYVFQWSGHIADALEIAFANAGSKCSRELREACCDLLVSSIPLIEGGLEDLRPDQTPLPLSGFSSLLGSDSALRTAKICSDIFRTRPPNPTHDITKAYANVVGAFSADIGSRVACSCVSTARCDLSQVWVQLVKSGDFTPVRSCLLQDLWYKLGLAIEHGYCSLLIDAQPNASTEFNHRSWMPSFIGLDFINYELTRRHSRLNIASCQLIHQNVMKAGHMTLAFSRGGCTSLLTPLLDLQINLDQGFRYKLFDGKLMINGRHYNALDPTSVPFRKGASKSMWAHGGIVRPSPAGEHNQISYTVRECSGRIEMRTTVLMQGQSIHVNLGRVITASMGLNDAPACDHDISDTLDPTLNDEIITTSVLSPYATDTAKIAIVQTKGNPTAQMLACDTGVRSVLQRKCCISCAVQYAKTINARQVIVGT